MLRFAAIGAVAGVFATVMGDAAAAVVLGVAAATSMGLVWRKGIAPLVRLSDLLAGLPSWMAGVDRRLDEGREHFEEIRDRLERLEQPAQVAAEKATAVARELDVASRD